MITDERIVEIRAGFLRRHAEYARECGTNHDGYACAGCSQSISLRDEAEWEAGESLCDACLTDESIWEFVARRDLLTALDESRHERDHSRAQLDSLAVSMIDQARDLAVVEKERDELRAALDNESGKGEPPSGGWEYDLRGDRWIVPSAENQVHGRACVVRHGTGIWRYIISGSRCGWSDPYTTARAAMIAADEAAKVTP